MNNNYANPYSGKAGLCPNCFKIHSIIEIVKNFEKLTGVCDECNKKIKLAAIDENIILAVKILNEKGYTTKYCCSGHIWHPNFYISFVPGCEFKKPLKEFGFIKRVDKGEYPKVSFYKSFKSHSEIELHKKILRFNLRFLSWVNSLPLKNKED